jgi:nucleoside-diphosphate-sugar epimerase
MRILVTGAAGFLGRECVRQLRASGHEVVTTDRHGDVDVVQDLATESPGTRLPDVDAVVHSAGTQYLSPDLPRLNRRRYFDRNNVTTIANLIARYSGADTHFVNVGTSMMYRQTGREEYDIASPMAGQGPYSASKVEAQALVARMPNPTACVVPCIIGGEGREGLFRSLVRSMQRYATAVYPGRGRHKIHIVHVQDAAALVRTVIERRATGLFNAASPQPLSIAEWVDEIASELQLPRIRRISVPLDAVEMLSAAVGHRLLAREQLLMLRFPHVLSTDESLGLGWTPKYTNAQIVRETARALTAS